MEDKPQVIFVLLSELRPILDLLKGMPLDASLLEGMELFAFGHHAKAIEKYSSAIEHRVALVQAHYLRSIAYLALDEKQKAVQDLTALLAENDLAFVHKLRGDVYAALGQHRKAIDDYDQALASPDREDAAELFELRGFARHRLGEYREAIDDYDQALSLVSENPQIFVRRAQSALRLNDAEKAYADFAHAWRLDPEDCFAWWMSEFAGLCLAIDTPEVRQERIQRIRNIADLCLASSNLRKRQLGRLCRGVEHWLTGRDLEAQKVLEEQISQQEGTAATCFWLGMSYLSTGLATRASEQFALALENNLPPVFFRIPLQEPRVREAFRAATGISPQ